MHQQRIPICTTLFALGAIGTFLWQVAINVHPRICAAEQRSLLTQPGWGHTISYEWHQRSCCVRDCYNSASKTWYCCLYKSCFSAGINIDMYQRDESSTVPSFAHYVRSCELTRADLFNSAADAVDAIAADYPLNGTFAAWYAESSGCAWSKSHGACIGAYFATITIALLGSCCSGFLLGVMGYGLDLSLAWLFCRSAEPVKTSHQQSIELATVGPTQPHRADGQV